MLLNTKTKHKSTLGKWIKLNAFSSIALAHIHIS